MMKTAAKAPRRYVGKTRDGSIQVGILRGVPSVLLVEMNGTMTRKKLMAMKLRATAHFQSLFSKKL